VILKVFRRREIVIFIIIIIIGKKKEEACNSNTFCPINRVIEAQFIIIFYGILSRCYYKLRE
tara:strand:+ start:544 stop:729 length:186 start_codon:yes stop_codon:yes gene_type:complete